MDLADAIALVEAGDWIPADRWYLTAPQPGPRAAAVVAFPGVSIVAADVDPAWVAAELPEEDLSAPLNPPFLRALEDKLARRVNNIDIVLMSAHLPGPPPLTLREVSDSDHPRVRRAHRYRDEVRVWETESGRGVLVVGRGLAGRWEVAVEVEPQARDRGLGRTLALAARHLVPGERPVWAQIAPGNAASVRAFLAAGYEPVGAEALLVP
ncbi:MAG: GNAT family N-acetyltransferase [Hamadaea sp.]|uniref:GNAT family N-acetyltransferase n=1 Tax=Hamadaea sp. NPDC050747 TaxID=3155789 RepID=UPI0018545E77|nr:GNAT family N-acetyltransferase [Hamadaea sp.]NUR46750.1 GNAT family N-acetyltransferase [Hamadaea sp.]NUT07489.1 GNAT family N-acetyltransferase [Hamadaea sp.]